MAIIPPPLKRNVGQALGPGASSPGWTVTPHGLRRPGQRLVSHSNPRVSGGGACLAEATPSVSSSSHTPPDEDVPVPWSWQDLRRRFNTLAVAATPSHATPLRPRPDTRHCSVTDRPAGRVLSGGWGWVGACGTAPPPVHGVPRPDALLASHHHHLSVCVRLCVCALQCLRCCSNGSSAFRNLF